MDKHHSFMKVSPNKTYQQKNRLKCNILCMPYAACMTDIAKKVKNATQDVEAKIKTEEDHAKGKPSSETVNKAKVKVRDALT